MGKYDKSMHVCFIIIAWGVCLLVIFNTLKESTLQSLFLIGIFSVLVFSFKYMKLMTPLFFLICFYLMLFFVHPVYLLIFNVSSGEPFYIYKAYTILTISGLYLIMLGACIGRKNTIKQAFFTVEILGIRRAIKLLVLCLSFMIVMLFIDAGTFNILSISRIDLKNAGSPIRTLANFGIIIISILFFLVAFSQKTRHPLKNIIWFCFLISMEVIIFMFYRERTMPVSHISSYIAGYYFAGQTKRDEMKLIFDSSLKSMRRTVNIWLSFVVVFFLSIISRFIRGFMEPGSSLANFDLDMEAFMLKTIELGDAGYASVVMLMLQIFPGGHGFFDGQSYYRVFFTVIPRFIWPDKPINTETIIGTIVDPAQAGFSLPPGIHGDLYVNFGMWGVLGMIVYGLVFVNLGKITCFRSLIVCSVSAVWIFHLTRGGFTNPLIIFGLLFVGAWFLDRYIINSPITKRNRLKVKKLNESIS